MEITSSDGSRPGHVRRRGLAKGILRGDPGQSGLFGLTRLDARGIASRDQGEAVQRRPVESFVVLSVVLASSNCRPKDSLDCRTASTTSPSPEATPRFSCPLAPSSESAIATAHCPPEVSESWLFSVRSCRHSRPCGRPENALGWASSLRDFISPWRVRSIAVVTKHAIDGDLSTF